MRVVAVTVENQAVVPVGGHIDPVFRILQFAELRLGQGWGNARAQDEENREEVLHGDQRAKLFLNQEPMRIALGSVIFAAVYGITNDADLRIRAIQSACGIPLACSARISRSIS